MYFEWLLSSELSVFLERVLLVNWFSGYRIDYIDGSDWIIKLFCTGMYVTQSPSSRWVFFSLYCKCSLHKNYFYQLVLSEWVRLCLYWWKTPKKQNKFHSIQKYTIGQILLKTWTKKRIFITSLLSVTEYVMFLLVFVAWIVQKNTHTFYYELAAIETASTKRKFIVVIVVVVSVVVAVLPSQWLSIKTCFKSYPNSCIHSH